MSDQEKKAIAYFYNLRATIDESNMLFDEDVNIKCGKETIKQITIILNLIEKQQKEIEELKEVKWYYEISRVSKDKIKAKIEEYKKLINECIMNDEEIFCEECTEKCSFNQTIDVLQSLLEEE